MNTILSRYRLRNTLVAGILALVGALLVAAYVTSYRNSVTSSSALVSIYVAAHDIPAGTDGASATGSGGLKRTSVLRRSVVPGAITNANQIANLSAAQTIFAGEQITLRQFHSLGQVGPLAAISGPMRVITIPGNNNQLLAGIIKDGDRVDLLANIRYARAGQSYQFTRVVLRNLLVLYAPGTSSQSTLSGATSSNNSVTFATTEQQAATLFFATQNTSWALLLRPVARPTDSSSVAETMQGLVGRGLSQQEISRLTDGQGLGSVSNGG